jgi:LacI family transcriptional regulator
MTASRTLSGGKYVRPALQQAVMEAVERLGYHRNENARSLRPGHSSGLVGLIITNLVNPYYGQMAFGIEQVATTHERRIILGNSGEDPERERTLVADFASRQVEGLIVVPSRGSTDYLSELRQLDIPLVLASRAVADLAVDTVLLDDVTGSYEATAHAIARGHRRLAFLGSGLSVSTATRRFEGFSRALAEAGLEPDPGLVFRSSHDVASAQEVVHRLLTSADPPTAVFAANNRNAIGALEAIGSLPAPPDGLPRGVISFDDIELAGLLQVPLITISHNPIELGAIAATMLFDRLEGDAGQSPRLVELPVGTNLANWG